MSTMSFKKKPGILMVGLFSLAIFFISSAAPYAIAEPLVIKVKKVVGPIPTDPNSPEWSALGETILPLSSQIIAVPRWYNAAVRSLNVKAMTNGKEIGIRLEWLDQTKNEMILRSEDFRDSAAVQFPVKPAVLPDKPHIAMGDSEQLVNIWHWKADWQADAGRMRDIDDAYPAAVADLYIEEKEGKTYFSQAATTRGVFHAGAYSGNILSDAGLRKSAVEDLSSAGFGTLTTQKSQDVSGYGVWESNRWKVVFLRSLTTNDENDVQLDKFKDYIPVAFAVWDGANGERDGQKAVSTWHYLTFN